MNQLFNKKGSLFYHHLDDAKLFLYSGTFTNNSDINENLLDNLYNELYAYNLLIDKRKYKLTFLYLIKANPENNNSSIYFILFTINNVNYVAITQYNKMLESHLLIGLITD